MIRNPALGSFGNQSGVDFLGHLLPALVGALLVLGVVVFIFTFLMGAIQWITAGGEKGGIEAARQKLTTALIGLVILLGFFAIISALECFFGIGLRQIEIGPYNVSLSGGGVCRGASTGGGSGPGGPVGGGTAGVTGNRLCGGCITGGCGITGQTYQGSGTSFYFCSATGWVPSSGPLTSSTCGAICQ